MESETATHWLSKSGASSISSVTRQSVAYFTVVKTARKIAFRTVDSHRPVSKDRIKQIVGQLGQRRRRVGIDVILLAS